MPFDTPTPELQTLTTGQYDLVFYAIVAACFALFAYFLYSWRSASEVGVHYRPAVLAGMCIAAVATASYLFLLVKWDTGFTLTDGVYSPGEPAWATLFPRYVDWTVTVPMLTAELLAVCSLAGAKARSTRFTTMTAAFLMIFTGFLGSQVVAQGRSTSGLVIWGIISSVFYLYLYIALIGAVLASWSSMSPEAFTSLRNASFVLLGTFGVYPLVYAVPVFVDVTPSWLVGMQLAYSSADVLAKVGFGVLIHKVAKLRTAEDVAAGTDTHPEAVWSSSVLKSVGVQPELKGISPAGLTALAQRQHLDGAARDGHPHDGHPHDGHRTGDDVRPASPDGGATRR